MHWKKFFAEHKTYFKVGTVIHVSIDPMSPIPPPCKSPQSGDGNPAKASWDQRTKEREPKEETPSSSSGPKKGETKKDAVRVDL